MNFVVAMRSLLICTILQVLFVLFVAVATQLSLASYTVLHALLAVVIALGILPVQIPKVIGRSS